MLPESGARAQVNYFVVAFIEPLNCYQGSSIAVNVKWRGCIACMMPKQAAGEGVWQKGVLRLRGVRFSPRNGFVLLCGKCMH